MDSDLLALETRIRQVADLAKRLRVENSDLLGRIAALESDNRRLNEKVATAADRLETLIKQMPE